MRASVGRVMSFQTVLIAEPDPHTLDIFPENG